MNLDEAIDGLEKLIAEVRRASLTDEKTPLGSMLSLRQEARLINEGKSEFDVVVFCDLNDFKHLNDMHGHEAGDVAINKVGEVIYKLFVEGRQGKAFRRSGDEFVILLKQHQLTDLSSLAISLSNIGFEYNGKPLSTGLSIGYVLSDGKTGFEDLLIRADLACQLAKASGNSEQWTSGIQINPLIRMTKSCRNCGARITCNIPKQNAPSELGSCPSCGMAL
jgi:diguanylate cyclase (GGDEF)-like protein